MSDHEHPPPERWDELLLAAGFDVDPDATLSGRAAAEAAADTVDNDDPWANRPVTATGLTDDQRTYVINASPSLGAELPGQPLTGDDPFGPIDDTTLRRADDDIIDFD